MSNAWDGGERDRGGIAAARVDASYLSGCGVADGLDEVGDLVAHGLGCDAGGGGLEVHLALAAEASRVASWHEGVHDGAAGGGGGGERVRDTDSDGDDDDEKKEEEKRAYLEGLI